MLDDSVYPDTESDTIARCNQTRARIRLLEGGWERDATARLVARLGTVRAIAVGQPDLSANPARSIWSQSATLYDREPIVSHPLDADGTATAALQAALQAAGVWPLMQRIQRQIIGLREMYVRVDVDSGGSLLVRPVTPDLVDAEALDDRPDRPASLRELRRREVDGGKCEWTYDVVDPGTLTYRVEATDGEDLSSQFLPDGVGSGEAAYPYALDDGTPVLPYVLYHAAQTGKLYDAFDGIEIVEGTYEVATLWSFWGHCARDASWPQRWGIGVRVLGATQEGSAATARDTVVTDPATVILLTPSESLEQGVQPSVGQWEPGADPKILAESIISYESRLPIYAGGNPADFARTSGDPRSGYALAISLEGQRAASRRYEQTQRIGDLQLLTLICAALNRWSESVGTPLGLPETGWAIRYPAIPLSPEEQAALQDRVTMLLDRRLISRRRAYSELWGVSLEQADRELAEIDTETTAAAA
jgi:hypothetical protein